MSIVQYKCMVIGEQVYFLFIRDKGFKAMMLKSRFQEISGSLSTFYTVGMCLDHFGYNTYDHELDYFQMKFDQYQLGMKI